MNDRRWKQLVSAVFGVVIALTSLLLKLKKTVRPVRLIEEEEDEYCLTKD